MCGLHSTGKGKRREQRAAIPLNCNVTNNYNRYRYSATGGAALLEVLA